VALVVFIALENIKLYESVL